MANTGSRKTRLPLDAAFPELKRKPTCTRRMPPHTHRFAAPSTPSLALSFERALQETDVGRSCAVRHNVRNSIRRKNQVMATSLIRLACHGALYPYHRGSFCKAGPRRSLREVSR